MKVMQYQLNVGRFLVKAIQYQLTVGRFFVKVMQYVPTDGWEVPIVGNAVPTGRFITCNLFLNGKSERYLYTASS